MKNFDGVFNDCSDLFGAPLTLSKELDFASAPVVGTAISLVFLRFGISKLGGIQVARSRAETYLVTDGRTCSAACF